MTRFPSMLVFVMFATFTKVAGTSGFLKSNAAGSSETMSKHEVQDSLLEEIEASLGSGTAAKKLHVMQDQLRTMYAALPKNEYGGLSHSVVRYALHRLFVQRHGWLVKGIDPAGGSFSDSSPATILKDQASAYLQDLFERRMHGKGLGLHELSVFAATIEHLIHSESVQRLGDALRLHKILPTSPLSEAEAEAVLDTYTMAYILGEDLKKMTLTQAKDRIAQMPELYLTWNETREFMRNMQRKMIALTPKNETNFGILATVAQSAGEHFGSFQDTECQDMKAKLVAIEDRGSGRVRLADFYRPALAGAWQFQESVSYLRQLGLLDETDPGNPRVIIVNYLVSQTNCIASSSFYSVCCMNECEALMGHIEGLVASAEVPAAHLAALVANLPSSSVVAPRNLSSVLLARLDGIEEANGGTVPIHGRLFAQWMHHAFPRECPYPHLSGTTSAQTAEEWLEVDLDPTASEEEMQQYTANPKDSNQIFDLGEVEILPWSSEEELLVFKASQVEKATPFSTWNALRAFLLVSTLVSIAFGFIQTHQSPEFAGNGHDKQSFLI